MNLFNSHLVRGVQLVFFNRELTRKRQITRPKSLSLRNLSASMVFTNSLLSDDKLSIIHLNTHAYVLADGLVIHTGEADGAFHVCILARPAYSLSRMIHFPS